MEGSGGVERCGAAARHARERTPRLARRRGSRRPEPTELSGRSGGPGGSRGRGGLGRVGDLLRAHEREEELVDAVERLELRVDQLVAREEAAVVDARAGGGGRLRAQ